MTLTILYGIISGFSLLVGALAGIIFKLNRKIISVIMAFGAGVLICALTIGLMENSFTHGGFDAVIIGFLLGGIVYILGDYFIHFLGGRKHKTHQYSHLNKDASGPAITLGAILDGIPESIALGISLYNSTSLGILMLGAIVISNIPEGLGSIAGLTKIGYKKWKIIAMWTVVAISMLTVVVLSNIFLHDIALNTIGILEAFAGGAILAMLASTMMPDAYEDGGYSVGLVTVLGFLVAFVLSKY